MKSLKPNIRARRNRAGTTSWCVDAGFCNSKRLRRFFKSKAEATCYADKLTVARKNQGDAAFSLTDEQRVDAIGALALLAGTGATALFVAVNLAFSACSKSVRILPP